MGKATALMLCFCIAGPGETYLSMVSVSGWYALAPPSFEALSSSTVLQ